MFARRRPRLLAARIALRVHAAATALVFAAATLLGMVHEATTSHVVCPEHGERLHGEAALAHSHGHHEAGPDEPRGAPALAEHGPVDGPADGHEHCPLSSALRESRLVAPPPDALARIAILEPVVEPAIPDRARELRLYRTAPKTSPPA